MPIDYSTSGHLLKLTSIALHGKYYSKISLYALIRKNAYTFFNYGTFLAIYYFVNNEQLSNEIIGGFYIV
ncbi:hypothetical protein J6TS2_43980 [Heyndrickxia sporothermodurans]|nr:hypothetical protein J6TS2_43980 [Heyndrickxia sporothermodurans]